MINFKLLKYSFPLGNLRVFMASLRTARELKRTKKAAEPWGVSRRSSVSVTCMTRVMECLRTRPRPLTGIKWLPSKGKSKHSKAPHPLRVCPYGHGLQSPHPYPPGRHSSMSAGLLLLEQVRISLNITFTKEHILTAVAPLRHVVWMPRYTDPCQPCHIGSIPDLCIVSTEFQNFARTCV